MAAKPLDRRVQRTRALLQDAMVALIAEQGYEATTVQHIIDRANVGRATFYAHFPDKEALLLSRLEDLRTVLQREARAGRGRGASGDRRFGFSLAMLQHAKAHWTLYQAMAGKKSGGVVLQRIRTMLTDLVREELPMVTTSVPRGRREMLAEFVTGAFMAVLLWWLESAGSLSPERMDESFHELVMGGLPS